MNPSESGLEEGKVEQNRVYTLDDFGLDPITHSRNYRDGIYLRLRQCEIRDACFARGIEYLHINEEE